MKKKRYICIDFDYCMRVLILLSFYFIANAVFGQMPLDSSSLAEQPTFADIEQALANPNKVYKLNLSQANLSEVPAEISKFKNLQILYLGSYTNEAGYYQKNTNQIKRLPDFIGNFAYLQQLFLSGNQLETLPETVGKLQYLEHLSIATNKLTALPASLKQLKRLKILVLYENKLTLLSDELGSLSRLEELYLHQNQLKKFPAFITKLLHLQELSLSSNEIPAIPDAIDALQSLRVLNIASNRIKTLPIAVGELAQLQILNLSNNLLQGLPENIQGLIQLADLNIAENRLKTLPTALGNLISLEELHIAGNQLKTLPENITNLISLKRLIASQNQLTQLPDSIGKLMLLETIELSQNQLKTLPASIGELTQLRSLSVNKNLLTTLPQSLGKLPNLKELFVERNQLQNLPASLEQSKSLKTIYISQNPLQNIAIELLTNIENAQWTMVANLEVDMREQYINPNANKLYKVLKPYYEKTPLRFARLLNYMAWWHKENKQYLQALALGKNAEQVMALVDNDSTKILARNADIQNEINDTRYKLAINIKAIRAIKENLDLQARITLYTQIGAVLMIVFAGIVAFLMYRNAQEQKAKNKIIEAEKATSEKLLLNILPKEVVQELKETGTTTVKFFPNASILFADVKGFSRRATQVTPQELLHELNETFTQMDNYAIEHKLERIKTIGDCYMAVAGCPEANNTHPVDICLTALKIQHWMGEEYKKRNNDFWQVRLGIHTGELVAGVIGKVKFAYDVWGGAVNTASRMESGGEVGKVNISNTTYEYVKDFFDCTLRGEIEAKNIGMVKTYFVDRIKPALSQDAAGTIPNEKFKAIYQTTFGEVYEVVK